MNPLERTRKRLVGVGALVACLAVSWYTHHRPHAVVVPQEAPTPKAAPVAMPVAQTAARAQTASSTGPGWQDFSTRFGSDLEPQFDSQGRLVSVRGKPGRGGRATEAFQPSDPQKAITRAKEVLEAARPLLGLQAELPLEQPIARGNEASAQVYFRETSGGVPVAPKGSVTVDLGPQGELLGLSSDYVPQLDVEGAPKLGADQARELAKSAGDGKAEGGQRVAWITGANGGRPQARQAYEFTVQGHQVVIDAETGAVLMRQDRRQF